MSRRILPLPLEGMFREVRDFDRWQLAMLIVGLDSELGTARLKALIRKAHSFAKQLRAEAAGVSSK